METIYIREVTQRYKTTKQSLFSVKQANNVYQFVTKIIKDNTKEHFVLLALNGAHEVIAYNIVSIGTATASMVHPREVFQSAILAGACAIVIAHNHPSGSLEPSKQDRDVTERIWDAGKLLNIPLLDHVIVSDQGYYSLAESTSILN